MNSNIQKIHINIDGVTLHGLLALHNESHNLVVFVQGAGGGRFSPRNRHVAEQLTNSGVSTLLIDLLTPGERNLFRTHDQLSNINWLRNRLSSVINWLQHQEQTSELSVSLFGSNLGAAAALKTAADRKQQIAAVISWSGRPELVKDLLPEITAPTLLVAGANDTTLVNVNREAAEHFRARCFLEIIPDAGHELKEPGKMEELSQICSNWLQKTLQTDK